jgi:hypothetical protein
MGSIPRRMTMSESEDALAVGTHTIRFDAIETTDRSLGEVSDKVNIS